MPVNILNTIVPTSVMIKHAITFLEGFGHSVMSQLIDESRLSLLCLGGEYENAGTSADSQLLVSGVVVELPCEGFCDMYRSLICDLNCTF